MECQQGFHHCSCLRTLKCHIDPMGFLTPQVSGYFEGPVFHPHPLEGPMIHRKKWKLSITRLDTQCMGIFTYIWLVSIITWNPKQPFFSRCLVKHPFFHGKDLVHHQIETTILIRGCLGLL